MSLTRQLALPLSRALPRWPLLVATTIAIGLAWTATIQPTAAQFRLFPARLGVLALAVCVAFSFDDSAAPVTDSLPHPLRLRRLVRAVYTYLGALLAIVLVVLIASVGMDLVWIIPEELEAVIVDGILVAGDTSPGSQFPAGRLVLEASTMIAMALAVAAVASHRGHDQPGRAASTVLLGLFLVASLLPEAYRPFASPTDQHWDAAADWWWAALVLCLVVGAVFSWETRFRPRWYRF